MPLQILSRSRRLISCKPTGGRELGDPIDWEVSQARQDRAKIVANRHLKPPAGFDYRDNGCNDFKDLAFDERVLVVLRTVQGCLHNRLTFQMVLSCQRGSNKVVKSLSLQTRGSSKTADSSDASGCRNGRRIGANAPLFRTLLTGAGVNSAFAKVDECEADPN